MYSFKNDYADGGHPSLLEALWDAKDIQEEGYGLDQFSRQAEALLKQKIGSADADIHFLAGGTLTNLVALSAFLKPYEAVISAASGHIYVHETGAVEATGHKVFPVEPSEGKLTPLQVREVCEAHESEHMVKPRLVYLSQPTEIGTLYSRRELTALRRLCDELDLYLYIDGARLGSALAAEENDLTLPELGRLSDAFYIGGTKNGALLGEALVICREEFKKDFRFSMKQRGAILAKGRLPAIQFQCLFKDDLYVRLGAHANRMARKLQKGILALGYDTMFSSPTNQIFPVLPEAVIRELEKRYLFYRWEKRDNPYSVVRLVCSWATEESRVDQFLHDLETLTREELPDTAPVPPVCTLLEPSG